MVFLGETHCLKVEQRGQIHYSVTASCLCFPYLELSEMLESDESKSTPENCKVIPGESRKHAPGVFSPCARFKLHVGLQP